MKKIGELREREEWVKAQREEGKRTFRAIGKDLGVGGQRVAQIYQEALSTLKAERNHPYCGLSWRAANILSYNDIRSAGELKSRWNGQKFELRFSRGLGVVIRKEMLRWAKIEEPPQPEVKRCRLCGRKLRISKDRSAQVT
jgi:hypothetical protein